MDLKSPIDDDGHILSGDPLLRFFKMRKWYVIVSLILLAYGNGWVDHQELFYGLRLSGVACQTVVTAVTIAGIYFIFQGLLLFSQVVVFYPESINSRAALINANRITRLQGAILKLQDKKPAGQIALGAMRHPIDDQIDDLTEQLNTVAASRAVSRFVIYATEFALDTVRVIPTPVFLFVMLFKFGSL